MARIITQENGKTFAEAKGELRRAIENVEVACGIPMMMQGYNLEDMARGIDEMMIRQPLGVVAAITPFNFPGDDSVLVSALRDRLRQHRRSSSRRSACRSPCGASFELLDQTGFPPGVVNLVNGGKAAVDALLDHPEVRAISFVGSTPVARYVYARAGANGKRAQCQGGAKNHVVVLPDADMDMTTQIVTDSAFGCAGQRCLASRSRSRSARRRTTSPSRSPSRREPDDRQRPRRRRADGAGDHAARASRASKG